MSHLAWVYLVQRNRHSFFALYDCVSVTPTVQVGRHSKPEIKIIGITIRLLGKKAVYRVLCSIFAAFLIAYHLHRARQRGNILCPQPHCCIDGSKFKGAILSHIYSKVKERGLDSFQVVAVGTLVEASL